MLAIRPKRPYVTSSEFGLIRAMRDIASFSTIKRKAKTAEDQEYDE